MNIRFLAFLGGSVLFAPYSQADQVISDDLIVNGSNCVGFDCVNGESFGFDTIRLKENNLRIRFQDTSSSASFPSNDWQITVNDSSNGGANKFSIDDIDGGRTPFTIEAGARSHSLYVDDGGHIGLGTSTPVVELHIVDGDTPTTRLEQNGSSGFTPQTWDVAGNETNFFVRDATNGSTLPFRIRPGAPTSAVDIGVSGEVGIGAAATSGNNLHIKKSGVVLVNAESTNSTAVQYRLTADGAATRRVVALDTSGVVKSQVVFGDDEIVLAGATNVADIFATVDAAGISLPAGAAFSVDGTNLAVPDYVFEEHYKLRPLEELKAFISQNKHLPEVPSNKEIRQNGLNISEMQLKLLKKVEELTLYTLKQQETIDRLLLTISKNDR